MNKESEKSLQVNLDRETRNQSREEVLYKNFLAAFSGFSDSNLEEKIKPRSFRGSIESVYKAFKELHEEFPDKFPGLYFSDKGGTPHSKELERNLFILGAFEMSGRENPRLRYLTVSAGASRAIQTLLGERYGESLKDFIPIAKKFRELVKKFEEPKSFSL